MLTIVIAAEVVVASAMQIWNKKKENKNSAALKFHVLLWSLLLLLNLWFISSEVLMIGLIEYLFDMFRRQTFHIDTKTSSVYV